MLMWKIHHVFESLVNPLMIALMLFAVCIIGLFIDGNSFKVRCGFIAVFVLLLANSLGWIPLQIGRYLDNRYPVIVKTDPNIHWVVVFGGGVIKRLNKPENYLLTPSSIKRLLEGVRLYRSLPNAKLILSGGPNGPLSEGEQMNSLAKWFDIPSKDRVVEIQSRNTADEALEIKQWVHTEPFYLVTSSIHMPRALALCQKQGLHPVAAPADFLYAKDPEWYRSTLPNSGNMVAMEYVWHEFLGIIWGKLTRII